MPLPTVAKGDRLHHTDIQDISDALSGVASKGVPVVLNKLSDNTAWALLVRNLGTLSQALLVQADDGTELLRVDENGVKLSRSGGAAVALPAVSVYNVLDYSVTRNSTTNQAAAIQDLFDDVAAAGGGMIYFPAGWYRVGSQINIGANTTVVGDGMHTTRLLFDDATQADFDSFANLSCFRIAAAWSDLSQVDDPANSVPLNAVVTGIRQVTLGDVTRHDDWGPGDMAQVYGADYTNGTADDTPFGRHVCRVISSTPISGIVYLDSAVPWAISASPSGDPGLRFRLSGSKPDFVSVRDLSIGIYDSGNPGAYGQGAHKTYGIWCSAVQNCTFQRIYVRGMGGVNPNGITIDNALNCHARDCVADFVHTSRPISGSPSAGGGGAGGTGFVIQYSTQCSIEHCEVQRTSYGITAIGCGHFRLNNNSIMGRPFVWDSSLNGMRGRLMKAERGCIHGTINNNVGEGAMLSGITITQSSDILVDGNVMDMISQVEPGGTPFDFIRVTEGAANGAQRITITNNKMRHNATGPEQPWGIGFYPLSNGQAMNCTVMGNEINNTYGGIKLNGQRYNVVGNKIDGFGVGGGIISTSTGAANNLIAMNYINGSTNAGIDTSGGGGGSIVALNRILGTATFNVHANDIIGIMGTLSLPTTRPNGSIWYDAGHSVKTMVNGVEKTFTVT